MLLFLTAMSLASASPIPGPLMSAGTTQETTAVTFVDRQENDDGIVAELSALLPQGGAAMHSNCVSLSGYSVCTVRLQSASEVVSTSTNFSELGAWEVVFGGLAAKELHDILAGLETSTGAPGHFVASQSGRIFCETEAQKCMVRSNRLTMPQGLGQ